MLVLRAILALLALPGVVAGVVPFLLVYRSTVVDQMLVPGGLLVVAGLVLLFWCVRDFFVSGRGTLAPWDPPKRFVRVGLYRFVRNPMYLAVLTIVTGWTVLFLSLSLVIYSLLLAAAFHVRVRVAEEPWLRRQFGMEWDSYSHVTGRWLPKWRKRRK